MAVNTLHATGRIYSLFLRKSHYMQSFATYDLVL